jgi:hypothetical protein
MSMCNCLHGIKVLIGYSDNVSRMVNKKILKVRFKKSHDCHILMGQFLAIAIRGILPVKVRDTIMKLCSFFNAISQKVVDPMKLTKLQDDLILIMCNLETIFPPSFFDLMPHLLHIVHEMKYLCPVFLHQMYPFERFMTVLKSMFVIKVTRKVAWSQDGQQRKLLSSSLIICISMQLVSLFRAMKGVCLRKGHGVTLLSMSIMSHTPKHIS